MATDLHPASPTDSTRSLERAGALIAQLARLGASVTAMLRAATPDPELATNVPVVVLFELRAAGPLRPSEIQELTGLTSGGVTKLIDRMEGHGVVRRLDGHPEGDRRGVMVALTPAGEALLAAFAGSLVDRIDEVREIATGLNRLLAE
jgi:DNA-binding MarR family transcriptional regulator